MARNAGFSLIELLVVVIVLAVLATLTIISINPYKRMVKTDDACRALYSSMRQARVQAITRRQFYGVVVNMATTEKAFKLSNSTKDLKFPARSVSIVDMGSINATDDEKVVNTNIIPETIKVGVIADVPSKDTAFPALEATFTQEDLAASGTIPANAFACYFDGSGRALNGATNAAVQIYRTFYFSATDITKTQSPTLLRAMTLYGSTGGLTFWKLDKTNKWIASSN